MEAKPENNALSLENGISLDVSASPQNLREPHIAPLEKINLSSHSFPGRSVDNYFLRTLMEFVERPWAPEEKDRPMRFSPEDFGNSAVPFRKSDYNAELRADRQVVLRDIVKTSSKERISNWSYVYNYSVPIDNLPQEFDGFRVLHVSDVHFKWGDAHIFEEVNRLIDWLNKQEKSTDLILLTGDILTYGIRDLDHDALKVLESLRSKADSAFFVSGNHDYHSLQNQQFKAAIEKVGYQNLDNQHAVIRIADQTINIYGVDDAIHGRPEAPQPLSPESVNILMTHSLDSIRANCPDCFDLMFSGHSHWGESKLFNGLKIMKLWGYADDINRHSRSWAVLTDRALSYVHPGLARHYIGVPGLRQPTGVAMHTLTNQVTINPELK